MWALIRSEEELRVMGSTESDVCSEAEQELKGRRE